MRQTAFLNPVRIYGPLCCSLVLLLSACNEQPEQKEAEVLVVEVPEPVVDSLQLSLMSYRQQLSEASEEVEVTVRQLDRLSTQLEDSIEGTEVPPQLQEEVIADYQNMLLEVKEMKAALQQWKNKGVSSADSLSALEQKAYLEKRLRQLEWLMQQSSAVKQEVKSSMQEVNGLEY